MRRELVNLLLRETMTVEDMLREWRPILTAHQATMRDIEAGHVPPIASHEVAHLYRATHKAADIVERLQSAVDSGDGDMNFKQYLQSGGTFL